MGADSVVNADGSMQLSDRRLLREQCRIGAAWCDADGGGQVAVHNPATGDVLGSVPDMGAAETRRAIEAAAQALPEWSRRTAGDRAQLLRRLHDAMMANQEDLAIMLTSEGGKPIAEARGEIAYSASFIE